MSTATITSKGQVTVPKDVREELGLVPGSRVTFTRNAEGDFVLSSRARSVKELKGRLGYHGVPKTLEEMDAGIAEGAARSQE